MHSLNTIEITHTHASEMIPWSQRNCHSRMRTVGGPNANALIVGRSGPIRFPFSVDLLSFRFLSFVPSGRARPATPWATVQWHRSFWLSRHIWGFDIIIVHFTRGNSTGARLPSLYAIGSDRITNLLLSSIVLAAHKDGGRSLFCGNSGRPTGLGFAVSFNFYFHLSWANGNQGTNPKRKFITTYTISILLISYIFCFVSLHSSTASISNAWLCMCSLYIYVCVCGMCIMRFFLLFYTYLFIAHLFGIHACLRCTVYARTSSEHLPLPMRWFKIIRFIPVLSSDYRLLVFFLVAAVEMFLCVREWTAKARSNQTGMNLMLCTHTHTQT